MELTELRSKCATILLNGNIRFSEVTDDLMVELSDDDKQVLIEYAISHILKDCLEQFAEKTDVQNKKDNI